MDQLKQELRARYIETYNACKQFKYTPHAFLDMVVSDEDIVEVTRRLIHKDGGTSGFTTLFENGRLDLSVEKIILEPKYRILFDKADLSTAYMRLEQYQYSGLAGLEAP